MIKNGSTVDVHYTGKLTSGETFDSSLGKEPLSFTMGQGQLIPGFENALVGLNVGDKVSVTIPSTEAYGEHRKELLVEVSKENMPGPVEVGQSLQAQNSNGMPVQVTVVEVHENHVIIDGNHPLSGKDLLFDIEVVDVIDVK